MTKTFVLACGMGLALAGCAANSSSSSSARAAAPVAQTAESPSLTEDVNTRYFPTALMGEDLPGFFH